MLKYIQPKQILFLMYKHLFGIIIFLFSHVAHAEEGTRLADVVSTFMFGTDIIVKLMWAVCIVVGLALIAAAFTQFQIHRRNPKIVPLATPILYLILGIAAIAIPFLGQSHGFLSSPPAQSVRSSPAASQPTANPNDIDAPLY